MRCLAERRKPDQGINRMPDTVTQAEVTTAAMKTTIGPRVEDLITATTDSSTTGSLSRCRFFFGKIVPLKRFSFCFLLL